MFRSTQFRDQILSRSDQCASPLLLFSLQRASGCIGNTGNGLKISETGPSPHTRMIRAIPAHTLGPVSRNGGATREIKEMRW